MPCGAKRLKALEDENRRLKGLVADLSLDKEALTTVIRKDGWSSKQPRYAIAGYGRCCCGTVGRLM